MTSVVSAVGCMPLLGRASYVYKTPSLIDTLPRQFSLILNRPQDQSVVGSKLIAAHEFNRRTRVQVARAVVRNGARALVDGVGAEIGDVAGDSGLRLVRCRLRAGVLGAHSVRHNLGGHVSGAVVIDDPGRVRPTNRVGLAIPRNRDESPSPDQALRGSR